MKLKTIKLYRLKLIYSHLQTASSNQLCWCKHVFCGLFYFFCAPGVLCVRPVQAQGEAGHASAVSHQKGAAPFIRHHREEQSPQHGVKEAAPPSCG